MQPGCTSHGAWIPLPHILEFLFRCRYLTPEGIEECSEEGRNSVDDIIGIALNVSILVSLSILIMGLVKGP